MSEEETREALASLELLMTEFFAPTTGNARKREIESVLEAFANRRDSWRHCLLFLHKSENHYVLMFTFTTLENIINRQWIGLSDAEKTEIRVTLWKHLTERHHSMVYFLRNKLAALIVAVARFDWPHLYPDFFTNIVELINRGGRSTLLGLILAHCASEELGTVREGCVAVPSGRSLELQRLMLKGMPQLLHALSDILEKNAQKDGHCDPPPSPSAGAPCPSALPDLLASSPDASAPNKELMMEIVIKCLLTLQHLFSWLPLSSHVPPSLVTTVFYWGSAATQAQCGEAALAGLGGVCELLYRRYAPPSSAATALRLHHCALRLLRHLTQSNMHQAPHQYLNKLAELLRLFVSLHFKRLEAEPEFDAIEFLSYLFQYTFQVPTCSIFVNCLDIWLQFVDIMKPEDTPKYSDALIALVNGVLNKIQFQHNKAQLQHLDNETVDDDGETEWQTFLKHCIECVARVADLAPLHVFTLVLERWQCLAGVHARAAGRGAGRAGGGPAGEGERLLAALLDLATLTRTLGRLVPALLNEEKCEKRPESVAAAATLLERAAGTLAGAALTRPHHAPLTPPHVAHALTHVHAEMFACMGACVCYASTCGVGAHVMEGLYASAVPFLMPHDVAEPPVVCHAAAHLVLSLSKNLKLHSEPTALLGDLFAQAQRSLQHLEPKTAGVVREALVSLALSREVAAPNGMAPPAASRGEAAVRALVAAWAAPLVDGGGPAAARVALPPLSQLLYAFTDAPTHAKKVLAGAMQRPATVSLQLLCESPHPELAEFFLALFTCLLQQLGDFAHAAIDVFLEVAKRQGGGEGLERLLTCVRLGVETGGAGGGGGGVRLAPVLQLLTQHALPHAADPAAPPDLQRALYKLLASILLHRWRYFFSNNSDLSEDTEKMEQFRTMLSAIGRSLLQPDIDVYRLNVETLEQLNTKWKLYHRAIFRSEFLSSFLSVLLLVLVERRQALLREETLAALYAMCAVDFAAFHHAFLPHFLSELPGLAPHQAARLAQQPPADTDLPTFTQNIQSLTNDIYYYRMCNSFLAPSDGDPSAI